MGRDDGRQQQELEEERMARSLEVLQRVARYSRIDAEFLAAELGLRKEFHQEERL